MPWANSIDLKRNKKISQQNNIRYIYRLFRFGRFISKTFGHVGVIICYLVFV